MDKSDVALISRAIRTRADITRSIFPDTSTTRMNILMGMRAVAQEIALSLTLELGREQFNAEEFMRDAGFTDTTRP
jgi:hypothetical protein